MNPLPRALRTSLIATPLLLALVGLPAAAETPAEPPTPMEKELESVRALISNAQMKLRRGIVGVAPAGEHDKMVRTPAQLCCGENVERINQGIAKLRELVRDIGTCFEQKWDRGGAEAVDLATQELRALSTGIKVFAEAMEPEDTHGALGGSMRAYLNLKKRLEALPPCDAGALAPLQ